jgi:hypothetical protein
METAIKTKNLLAVKTIAKKHFTQITVVPYDWKPSPDGKVPLFRELYEGIKEDRVAVLGWVSGPNLNRIDGVKFWLVKRTGNLFLIVAPDKGELYDHVVPGLEQLFVD